MSDGPHETPLNKGNDHVEAHHDVTCESGDCEAEADADSKLGCMATIGGDGLGGALMLFGLVGLQRSRRSRRAYLSGCASGR